MRRRVSEDDNSKHNEPCGEYFSRIMGHNGGHDQRDRDDRDRGQNAGHAPSVLTPYPVDDQTKSDGENHHLDDGQEHADDVDFDRCMQEKIGQGRCQDGSQKRIDAGHSNRQGNIASGKVSDDIAGCPSGTGSHKDHTRKQSIIQPKQFSQSKRQERHDGKLRDTADQNIPRPGKDKLKIGQVQCQSHAEHDNHQQIIDPAGLNPQARFRDKERNSRHDKNEDSHVIS